MSATRRESYGRDDERRGRRVWMVILGAAGVLLAAYLFTGFRPVGLAALGIVSVSVFWKLVLDFRDAMEKWNARKGK